MSASFIYNNKFCIGDEPVIGANSRALRYGDGLFETLKMVAGTIILKDYHFERLFEGLKLLKFDIPKHFTPASLEEQIIRLAKKNDHSDGCRIRLMVFRGNGGLYDPADLHPNFIIQTFALENSNSLNSNGLTLDIYRDAKKACDNFSRLKTNNFLPYLMAALYAKERRCNDAIVLNEHGRICDTTIANIFIVMNETIYTPPLSEGCIAGVTRRWILEKLSIEYNITEQPVTLEMLENAQEVFLTNSIFDIRWVKEIGNTSYTCSIIRNLYESFLQTIY